VYKRINAPLLLSTHDVEGHTRTQDRAQRRHLPGEAKLQLKERLSHSKSRSERVVEIETTDKLTDPQIVAKVKDHYRIDR
jgi:hypothetical protein